MTYIYGTLEHCVDELWKRIDWEKQKCPEVDFAAIVNQSSKSLKEARQDACAWFGIKNVTEMFNGENIALIVNYYGGGGFECIELIDDSEDTKEALMSRIGNSTDMAGYGILDPEDVTLFEIKEEG